MKLNYKYLFTVLLVSAFVWAGQTATAQEGDTLTVPWSEYEGGEPTYIPAIDTLRNVIAGDTTASGERAHSVYKLKRGGFYHLNAPIENPDFKLTIVGEKGDPEQGVGAGNPPVIQLANRGETPPSALFTAANSMTLKNVWLVGSDDQGAQSYYTPADITGSQKRYVFDNVIFERTNFSIPEFTGGGNTIIVRNSTFRNHVAVPTTQQWEGRGLIIGANQDSVIIENNTFFNIGMSSIQQEGSTANFFLFNHNTIVNQGRNFIAQNKKEHFFANNLILNGFWHGEGVADLTESGRPQGQYASGMFSIGVLAPTYGLEQERRIVIANNYSWRNPRFQNELYPLSEDSVITMNGTDSTFTHVHPQPFLNDSSRYFTETNDQIVVQDTVWMNEMPQGISEDAVTGAIIDSMWTNIDSVRMGGNGTAYMYPALEAPGFYTNSGNIQHTTVDWPLPEDFAYTDSELMDASTDGLPVGDLNWFPNEKEQYYNNRESNVQTITDLAGAKQSFDIYATVEAEDGTYVGNAEMQEIEGTKYFYMEGGGYIEWNFNLDQAGTYSLDIYSRSQDAERGQNVILNGTNLRNDDGAGEFKFYELMENEWKVYTASNNTLIEGSEALDMESGEQTLRLEPSWGWQAFWKVEVKDSEGNVVETLTAPEAETELMSPGVEDAEGNEIENVPSKFRQVVLNGAGDGFQVDVSDLDAGDYLARIYYTAPDGDRNGELTANGSLASNITFARSNSQKSVSTDVFTLDSDGNVVQDGETQATSTMELTADGSMTVDFIQLAKKGTASGIDRGNQMPEGYALEQNYPNPFNPSTTIRYELAQASDVQLTVYNVLGQRVAQLVDSNMSAGQHSVRFDASNLASGVYFYRLQADDFTAQKQMMLIK